MPRPFSAAILLVLLCLLSPAAGRRHPQPESPDPGGVLRQLTIASLDGSGQNSIQAMATDANGNIYVAGTTDSADFPVENAEQPNFGDARILKTTDLGNTWTRVGNPPQDVTAVAVDPTAPQVIFAAGAVGIYRSTDGGQTWELVDAFGAPTSYPANASLAIDPGNHLHVAALNPFSNHLVISLDGGETWTVTSTSGFQLAADPAGSGALLVGAQLSRDWGATFQLLAPPGPGSPGPAAFDPSHPGWIYVGMSQAVMGSLYLSTDFGATWTAKGAPPTTFSAIQTLAVDPNNSSNLLATTPDGLYLSTDGGATWKQQDGFGQLFQVDENYPFTFLSPGCGPAGTVAAAETYSGGGPVGFSPDYGATWNEQLTHVTSVTAEPGCAVYVTRELSTDAFVAKLAPGGAVLWATYLGGTDQDAPAALAVDGQGNAYVAGTTYSPDFPATAARIGVQGANSAFVTRFSTDGKISYSVLIGGEANNTPTAIAMDGAGNVYLVGNTDSQSFPVSAGALVSTLQAGSYTGFLVKLSYASTALYSTYLGTSYTSASSVLVDSAGEVVVGGTGTVPGTTPPSPNFSSAFLMKLSGSGQQVLASAYIQGASSLSALATDSLGDIYAYGAGTPGTTAGAYAAPAVLTTCTASVYDLPLMTAVYVAKLAAADWKPLFTAGLTSPCGIATGAMMVDTTGAAIIGMATDQGLPLRHPLLAGPTCDDTSSAIAKLSPDGSTLVFSTYLDDCDAPAVALSPDGSVYAGVSAGGTVISGGVRAPAGVLHMDATNFPPVSLDQILNALSGDAGAVAENGLYAITGTGFAPPATTPSLTPSGDLPASLGGVQVYFDGVATPILGIAPGSVIMVAPQPPPERLRPGTIPPFRAVQLMWNGVASNPVWIPAATSRPGLLTRNFPALLPVPISTNELYFDAYALNQDGTVNDAAHPAAAGSTLTLFATGMGATNPPVVPGSVAHSAGSVPVVPIWSSFDQFDLSISMSPPADPASTVPGYVSALFQVQVPVPANLQNLAGTTDTNGVLRTGVNLQYQLYFEAYAPPASNRVGVYLK